jgi:hypothetical protein
VTGNRALSPYSMAFRNTRGSPAASLRVPCPKNCSLTALQIQQNRRSPPRERLKPSRHGSGSQPARQEWESTVNRAPMKDNRAAMKAIRASMKDNRAVRRDTCRWTPDHRSRRAAPHTGRTNPPEHPREMSDSAAPSTSHAAASKTRHPTARGKPPCPRGLPSGRARLPFIGARIAHTPVRSGV